MGSLPHPSGQKHILNGQKDFQIQLVLMSTQQVIKPRGGMLGELSTSPTTTNQVSRKEMGLGLHLLELHDPPTLPRRGGQGQHLIRGPGSPSSMPSTPTDSSAGASESSATQSSWIAMILSKTGRQNTGANEGHVKQQPSTSPLVICLSLLVPQTISRSSSPPSSSQKKL